MELELCCHLDAELSQRLPARGWSSPHLQLPGRGCVQGEDAGLLPWYSSDTLQAPPAPGGATCLVRLAFCTQASCTLRCLVGLRAGKPSVQTGQRNSSRYVCFCARPAVLSSPKLVLGLKPQPVLPSRHPGPRCLLPKGSCPSE